MSIALYVDAGIQASKYCNAGTFAVLIYDYYITLDAESQWVWHRKWTFVRFIFTVSRYLPFFGIGLTFVAALRTQYYPGESCVAYGRASTALHIVSILATEGLLMTRIYASWHSKRILISLPLFCGICLVISYIFSDTELVWNSTYTSPPYMNMIGVDIPDPGDCLFLSGRNGVFSYAALLLFESVLFCLMLFIRFRRYKHPIGLLQRTFFHDTMKYMICIILMSSFSILLTMVAPGTWVPITNSPQVVIHSVLASRILFNLRESEERSRMQVDISEILVTGSSNTIRFAAP
ncbi:hypothetical protein P692DRAFT_20244525 [Suillus brevipes Sb2]|nr:hypothetical protein P692DRAFT_20244525 [Suillus brevipes Sb2]